MESKLTKEKVIRGTKITLNVIFYVVIVLILLFAIANMRVKTDRDIPNILGRGFLSVQSDSMEGHLEDSFSEGDLIVVRMLNDKRREELKVGDIVTFYGAFYNDKTDKREVFLNTHRIVKVSVMNDGTRVFITQGDRVAEQAGKKYDEGGENDDRYYETIYASEAIAVHTKTWAKAGATLDYLRSPVGFGIFIVVPAVLILIVEAYFLIRNVLKMNKDKMEKEFKDKDEALRQQIMEEILKQQEEKAKQALEQVNKEVKE